MHQILPKLRWETATFADINRKMPIWEIPLGHLQATPKAHLVAEGADVYNGSFPLDQASRKLVTGVSETFTSIDSTCHSELCQGNFYRIGLV